MVGINNINHFFKLFFEKIMISPASIITLETKANQGIKDKPLPNIIKFLKDQFQLIFLNKQNKKHIEKTSSMYGLNSTEYHINCVLSENSNNPQRIAILLSNTFFNMIKNENIQIFPIINGINLNILSLE